MVGINKSKVEITIYRTPLNRKTDPKEYTRKIPRNLISSEHQNLLEYLVERERNAQLKEHLAYLLKKVKNKDYLICRENKKTTIW